ncbi:MAG: alpha/beta hydrolase [Spirosomaceae bacterium]|jgi:pimeloyl-ACP methyl ester carboxylesterase|nr:alpha/beta hydrolase [Spirosomataceae bacterium]
MSQNFLTLYKGNDPVVIEKYSEFRNIPIKKRIFRAKEWQYFDSQSGAETILFLHGMAGAYDFWWQQYFELKDNYRLIIPTYPAVDNLEEVGLALMDILNHEKISKVHVIGSSMGGYYAQYLLTHFYNRIEKIVFGNTFPPEHSFRKKYQWLLPFSSFISEKRLLKTIRNRLDKPFKEADYHPIVMAHLLENTYGSMSKQQFIARYKCIIEKFEPRPMDEIENPILIFESDNDNVVNQFEDLRTRLKQTYPIAKVYTFEKKGHFPYLNATTEYNERLRRFLEA